MSQTHSKISKAKARLLMQHPFFATLLVRTPVVVTDNINGMSMPLAATDGEAIYYNPEFLEECSVEDVMTVLAHEVGHDSLLHSLRLGARDPSTFNQAADHAINLMLIDQGFKCPSSVPGGWLADTQYKGWSADRIYDDLRRKQKDAPKKGKPGQNGANGKPGPQQPGKDWLHGDVLPNPKSADPASQAVAEQKAKQRVAAAANMARMAGKLHGELERMVGEFLEAKVHWTDVLREYMTRIVKSRDNWSRRNRRFDQFYLPTRHSTQLGPIIFIPDTSGSMMGDDMEKICSEMSHCAMQTQPENIRVCWADTKVHGEQVFQPDEFSYEALKPAGGGGTDMRVPLKHVEQFDPQVVVLLTDCYTPWPDTPCPFPVICISTTSQDCPSWMERIEI
jgi:predicted metal-dependent peptidase